MSPSSPKSRQALEKELDRVRLMYRIGRLVDPTSDSTKILRSIVRESVRALRAASGSIALIDADRKVLDIEVAVNIDPKARREMKLRVGEGVTGHVAKTGRPLLVNDVTKSKRYVSIRKDIASEMAAALIIGGNVIGVLNVDADRKDAFSADDKELLVAAAEESARVIQIARLHEQIRVQTLKLETLYSVGQTITTAPTLAEVLDRIAAEVKSVMAAEVCSILLLDEKGDNLIIEATAGAARSYTRRAALSVEDTLVGRVVREGAPLAVKDVRKAPEFSQRSMARREKLCSLLSVPIDYLGRTIGALNIYTGKRTEFGEAETSLLKALAGQSAMAIENARRTARISEAEEQLRQSEKLSVLGALAAEIAHEIRNPITTVQMLAEALAGDFSETDPRRQDVAVIQNKLRQMNRIVDQVLDMARAREIHAAPFDVREAIEDTLFLTERRMASSGIELRKRFAADSPQAYGDRGQIEQALLNLILNGCQAMSQGGRLSVSTSLKTRDGERQIAIRVRDSGPGIPAAQMERIFTPFFTTRSEGVGMGLFVARRVMRAHSGDLTVQSRTGEGAVFEATLPAAPDESELPIREDSGRA